MSIDETSLKEKDIWDKLVYHCAYNLCNAINAVPDDEGGIVFDIDEHFTILSSLVHAVLEGVAEKGYALVPKKLLDGLQAIIEQEANKSCLR